MGGFGSLSGEVDREEAELHVSCGKCHRSYGPRHETCPYCAGLKVAPDLPKHDTAPRCLKCGEVLTEHEWTLCRSCCREELPDYS